MNKCMLLVPLILVAVLGAQAQEVFPEVEIFTGFSWNRFQTSESLAREDARGLVLGLHGNLSPHWGFTVELAQQVGETTRVQGGCPPEFFCIALVAPFVGDADFKTYQVLTGPRYRRQLGSFTGFAQALVGANEEQLSSFVGVSGVSALEERKFAQTSHADFAMALGGGLDYLWSDSLSIRVFQMDYLPVRTTRDFFAPRQAHNYRFQAGMVFRFGEP